MCARWLTRADNGVLQAALSLVLLSSTAFQVGWPESMVFGIQRVRRRPDRVVADGIVVTVLGGVACAVTAWAGSDVILARLLPGGTEADLALTVALVWITLTARIFGAVARSVDRFVATTTHIVVGQVLRVLGVVALAVTAPSDATAALGVVVAAEAVALVPLVVQVWSVTGATFRLRTGAWRKTLAYAVKAVSQQLGNDVHERVDLFLLAAILADPEQLAIYGLAVGLAERLRRFTTPLTLAALPTLASLPPAAAARAAARIVRFTFVFSIGVCAVIAAVSIPGVPLVFGEPYRPSLGPLLVLLAAVVALAAHNILSTWFSAVDRQGVNAAVLAVSIVVNVALNLLWIPDYGVMGSAAASLVSYGLESVLSSVFFLSASGLGWRDLLVPEPGEVADRVAYLRGLAGRLRRR
jgi:O-antigen/teichoic acid export membrane protein